MRQFADGLKEKPKAVDADLNDDALEQHYMSKKERRQYKIQREKEKLAEMNKTQKMFYILDYYKWPIIITLVCLFAISSISHAMYLNSRPVALRAGILNAMFDDINDREEFTKDIELMYRDYYSLDKKQQISIEADFMINPTNYEEEVMGTASSSLSSYELLAYKIQNNYFDVLITDEAGFTYCQDQDLVFPLNCYFTEEELKPYSDHIVAVVNKDGDTVDYAFDITDTKLADKFESAYGKTYAVFVGATEENKTHVLEFVKFVFD